MSTVACTWAPFGLSPSPRKQPLASRFAYVLEAAGAPKAAGARPDAPGAKAGVDAQTRAMVAGCLRGDGLAWAELVRAHQARVYGLCYRFTGSAHEAEDLTQDVFLKIYGHLRLFDAARGPLSVWVTTLTRNHLVDHYRRSRLQRASGSLDEHWHEADAPAFELEDRRPGPHAHALQHELEREVQAALAQVSPELREAVILRDLQDMDYRDIAGVLGIPEGTVKSRISRGRAELARLLGRKGREVS